jgi:tetratricopeptide (TPR) repeat protein
MEPPMLKKLLIVLILFTINSSYATSNQNISYYELLNDLLVANIAADREQTTKAMHNYINIARHSSDPRMAQLATDYAIKIQDQAAAIEMSTLWASLAKKDLRVQIIAATLTIDTNPAAAQQYITNAIAIHPDAIDQNLLEIFFILSNTNQIKLQQILYTIAERKPSNAAALLSAAQIAAQLGDIEKSLHLVNASLKITANLSNAIELKARLIRYTSTSDLPALTYLSQMLTQYPSNLQLKLFYAKALIDNDQITKAILHLKELLKIAPDNGEALIVLGKIYLEQNNFKLAKRYFLTAEKISISSNIAKYLLATIAEQENNIPDAINWYSQVNDTQLEVASKLRAAILLSLNNKYTEAIDVLHSANPETIEEQKQLLLSETSILIEAQDLDSAMKIANAILELNPEDLDFLYVRSLINSLNTNWHAAKQDLLTILQIDPEHKAAYDTMQKLTADIQIPNFNTTTSDSNDKQHN